MNGSISCVRIFFMPQEQLREALKPLAVDFESSQASRESNLLGRVLDVIWCWCPMAVLKLPTSIQLISLCQIGENPAWGWALHLRAVLSWWGLVGWLSDVIRSLIAYLLYTALHAHECLTLLGIIDSLPGSLDGFQVQGSARQEPLAAADAATMAPQRGWPLLRGMWCGRAGHKPRHFIVGYVTFMLGMWHPKEYINDPTRKKHLAFCSVIYVWHDL